MLVCYLLILSLNSLQMVPVIAQKTIFRVIDPLTIHDQIFFMVIYFGQNSKNQFRAITFDWSVQIIQIIQIFETLSIVISFDFRKLLAMDRLWVYNFENGFHIYLHQNIPSSSKLFVK